MREGGWRRCMGAWWGGRKGGGREGLITEFELVGEFFAPMTVIESH